ncbi:MAG: LysR family transcriptional regulator [Herbaspirillum sp.]|jgi:DNA-binding transcriptional LysR family regulator|nr:LysR family transcriptional regulator [Herbaspirillum sp.]
MDLRHFRYFVAVAEELHFSRAAVRLNISQPPLSKHIQEIEALLGVTLLERTRRRVELTEAGRIFLEEARAVLAQAAHAIDTGKRIARGEIGELRIGFTATAAYLPRFSRAVRAYRLALPDVHLELRYMTSEPMLDALLLGDLDVGMIRPSATLVLPPEITSIPILKDRLMLAVHADDMLTRSKKAIPIESLAQHPFVLRPRGYGSSFYEQVYTLCELAGFKPRIAQDAHEAPTILGLVAAGVGITILPASLQAIKVADIAWRDLSAEKGVIDSAVLLVFKATTRPTPQRARFIQLVRQLV